MARAPLTQAEIGELLRRQRDKLGKTQAQVAEEVGCTQPAVSDWESGESLPRTNQVRDVAKAYGVRPELLLPASAA